MAPGEPGEDPVVDPGPGDLPDSSEPGPDAEGPSRRIRWFGGCLLAALVVPGLLGLELWPLTGWKMFSLARGDTGTAWILEGVDRDGDIRLVDLEELPVAYSNAEWQLREMGRAPDTRREEVCQAMVAAVVEVDPTIAELRIARDDQQLVEVDGSWEVEHDLEVHHSCEPDVSAAGEDGL